MQVETSTVETQIILGCYNKLQSSEPADGCQTVSSFLELFSFFGSVRKNSISDIHTQVATIHPPVWTTFILWLSDRVKYHRTMQSAQQSLIVKTSCYIKGYTLLPVMVIARHKCTKGQLLTFQMFIVMNGSSSLQFSCYNYITALQIHLTQP